MQIAPDRYAAMPEIDHVIGNEEKLKAESFFALAGQDAPRVAVADIMGVKETAGHLISGYAERTRAFVEIQQGCDHRCTFCIIPYGRGNNRSVPIGEVVAQVRTLAENGVKEVVLTGVDITGYGGDLPGEPSLGQLCRRLLALVPDLPRLRLSSIDVVEVDADLKRLIAEEPRLMPHLHLSLQAGDDMILKRMKRRHLRDDAIRFCREVRDAAARHRVRRRPDRRLPDRKRRDVRQLAGAGRGMRPHLPARLPVLGAGRHAGGAHAAAGGAGAQGARGAAARGGAAGARPLSRRAGSARRRGCWWSAAKTARRSATTTSSRRCASQGSAPQGAIVDARVTAATDEHLIAA